MRSYEPSWREKIAWALAGQAGRLGAGRYAQQDIAGKIGTVLDFIPGVGEAVGANEAYRDAQAGNYGAAAIGAGLIALGAVPGAGDLASNVARKGMDIAKASETFANIMRRHGVEPRVNRSGLSESTYFDLDHGDKSVRVRGSSHVAKPTYERLNGFADVEFGEHDMSAGDEMDAAFHALRALGIEPDAELGGIVGQRNAEIEARRQAQLQDAIARANYVPDPNVIDAYSEVARRYPEEWAEVQSRSANGRKKGTSRLLERVRGELTAEGKPWR